MNKLLCGALFALTLSPFAQAQKLYVGLNVAPPQDDRIEVQLDDETRRYDATTNHTSYGLYAGFAVTPRWAVEGGYSGLHAATAFDLEGAQIEAKRSQAYLAARGTWQLSEAWSLFGKAGLAQGRMKLAFAGPGAPPPATVRKTGLYASGGVAYAFSPNVAAQMELEHAVKLEYEGLSAPTSILSLGLRYGF